MFTQSFNHFCPGWQALGARDRRKGFDKAEIKIRKKIKYLRYNNSFNKRLLLLKGKIIHINPKKLIVRKHLQIKKYSLEYPIVQSRYAFKVKGLITKPKNTEYH